MHFNIYNIFMAALIGSTLANPLPTEETTTPSPHKANLTPRKVAPGTDSCIVRDGPGYNTVEIYATKKSMPTSQFCGKGYLDNLRGRCGVITNWECKFVDNDVEKVPHKEKNGDKIKGALMTFKTNVFCSENDIIQAMGAASADHGHKPGSCVTSPPVMIP